MQMACTLVKIPPLHYVVSFTPGFFILLVLVLICFFLLGFAIGFCEIEVILQCFVLMATFFTIKRD
ncbi:hypothetical protein RHGRI_027039 [Rhododendron griersonianum]|uniref:Uncharacterized protein n=1 Tax=Rhododendron griersonianum TaxID=479676 RepID=A0AAV6IWD9_9ERIC|nr:hypothetical protein RHGRI_027039 [Rhododendron griersonianum]